MIFVQSLNHFEIAQQSQESFSTESTHNIIGHVWDLSQTKAARTHTHVVLDYSQLFWAIALKHTHNWL